MIQQWGGGSLQRFFTVTDGDGSDTSDGGTFGDMLDGGAGDDVITGGDDANAVPFDRIAFKWSDIPDPDNGGQIDNDDEIGSGTQTVNGVDITYATSNSNAVYNTGSVTTAGIDGGSGTINSNSSISFDDDINVSLAFEMPVTDVAFRINDFENDLELFNFKAFDVDGNLIPFTVTRGSEVTGYNSDSVPGQDTFYSDENDEGTSVNQSVLFNIPGPVASIVMTMSSTGGTLTGTDIYFDDPFSGSTGETIAVSVDANGDGTVAKANDGSTDTITSIETLIAGEDAAEADSITLTDSVTVGNVSGLNNTSIGTFTTRGRDVISFGGGGEPTINDILAGTYIHPTFGQVGAKGIYQISSGEEDGAQLGNISFQNFEDIAFDVVCFAGGTRIETSGGEVPIEKLAVGDMVLTLDHGGAAHLVDRLDHRFCHRQDRPNPHCRRHAWKSQRLAGFAPTEDNAIGLAAGIAVRRITDPSPGGHAA